MVSVVSVSPTMRTWGCFVSRWREPDHPAPSCRGGIHLDGPQHDRGKSILDWQEDCQGWKILASAVTGHMK